MPRFKPVHQGLLMLPVDFDKQVQPGSFEYALCHLVDHKLDLEGLRSRIKNDDGGAPAYDPAVLLKIVLLSYSRGIISSRKMETACRDNVLFMAVSGDSQPHSTTLAAFVSQLGDEAAKLFAQVLWLCDAQGLIGREMFAIDGVKLLANASKARSGKRADFVRQLDKLEKQAKRMVEAHREADAQPDDEARRDARKLERIEQQAEQKRRWLQDHPKDKPGAKGRTVMSNLTDNDSAKMATDKGVIQGYTGVAAVDAKHQVIIDAQAFGTGSEQALLAPVVDATEPYRNATTVITADAGYHSKAGLEHLEQAGVPAFIADNGYRQRDPRYAGQEHHRAKEDPLHDKSTKTAKVTLFGQDDFILDRQAGTCTCPAGKSLYSNGSNCVINGLMAIKFRGTVRDCQACGLRDQCLRKPDKTKVRQVAFFSGKAPTDKPNLIERMKQRIDSALGKLMIAKRFATVEPVFANLRHNKGLKRFTLRGTTKVDGQWKLYALMHNIEKLAGNGYAV